MLQLLACEIGLILYWKRSVGGRPSRRSSRERKARAVEMGEDLPTKN